MTPNSDKKLLLSSKFRQFFFCCFLKFCTFSYPKFGLKTQILVKKLNFQDFVFEFKFLYRK